MATKKLSKAVLAALVATLVANNATGAITYLSEAEYTPLVEAGLAEINTAMVEDGKTATRATQKALDEAGDKPAPLGTVHPSTKETFALEAATPPAVKGRGRTGAEMYPFASMEVGISFFVPVSDSRPEPAKSLASTISSANRRYSQIVEGQSKVNRKGETVAVYKSTRQYIVRARTAADEAKDGFNHGKDGARVYRTA